ncbi:MAG: LCP family protein [Bacilli bacterium]|nr:LCP family protein [Bacilli bacterium]
MKWLKNRINNMPNKKGAFLATLFLTLFIGINIYFIYILNRLYGIENFIRYSVISISIILIIIMVLSYFNVITKRYIRRYTIYILIIIIIGSLQLFVGYNIHKGLITLDNLNKEFITYSTSLVGMKDSSINNIDAVKDLKLGIISDENNIEGYVISKEIIDEYKLDKSNKIIEYDNFIDMILSLYEGEVDLIFLSSNYGIMFSSIDEFKNIKEETKIIYTKDKKTEKKDNVASKNRKLTEPFTVLVMGVDSDREGLDSNAAFNGDTLMLITFNPNTLNATIWSIPRDTYVPIMCFKGKIENKITHSGWYGKSCVIDTIENFTGIDIDYYVTTNFRGVISLVDALGGVEVDIPVNFCAPNSKRGVQKDVCVSKGIQVLNGEKALAFIRNRNLYRGDIDRGRNQQVVINAMLNKIKDIRSLNQVYSILDAIGTNIDTNLDTNEILSFYDVGKDIISKASSNKGELISMQRLHLDGYGQRIWDEGMRLTLYNYIYTRASLRDVVEAMEVNLGIKEPKLIKTFTFSINDKYTPKAIGEGPYKRDYFIPVVPNFTSYNKDSALKWGINNTMKIEFEIVDEEHKNYKDTYKNGKIIKQSVPEGYKMEKLSKGSTIVLQIVSKSDKPVKINCSLEENYEKNECLLPNMIGWTYSKYKDWKASLNLSIMTDEKPIKITDPLDIAKAGTIYSQSVESGTTLAEVKVLTIEYYEEIIEERINEEEEPTGEENIEE